MTAEQYEHTRLSMTIKGQQLTFQGREAYLLNHMLSRLQDNQTIMTEGQADELFNGDRVDAYQACRGLIHLRWDTGQLFRFNTPKYKRSLGEVKKIILSVDPDPEVQIGINTREYLSEHKESERKLTPQEILFRQRENDRQILIAGFSALHNFSPSNEALQKTPIHTIQTIHDAVLSATRSNRGLEDTQYSAIGLGLVETFHPVSDSDGNVINIETRHAYEDTVVKATMLIQSFDDFVRNIRRPDGISRLDVPSNRQLLKGLRTTIRYLTTLQEIANKSDPPFQVTLHHVTKTVHDRLLQMIPDFTV